MDYRYIQKDTLILVQHIKWRGSLLVMAEAEDSCPIRSTCARGRWPTSPLAAVLGSERWFRFLKEFVWKLFLL